MPFIIHGNVLNLVVKIDKGRLEKLNFSQSRKEQAEF